MQTAFAQLGYSICLIGAAVLASRFFPTRLDRLERIGLAGLFAMGLLGWLCFLFVWLVPGSGHWPWMAIAIVFFATVAISAELKAPKEPIFSSKIEFKSLWPLVLLVIPLVKSQVPSDLLDWDTLAYHFAVPKIWMAAGQAVYIPFIHHSNFPFMIDSLFLIGLSSGEPLAKLQTVLVLLFGALWLAGWTHRKAGKTAMAWSLLLYLGTPLVLWSSGSGYIDVGHGLFAAIAVIYGLEAVFGDEPMHDLLWIAACGLGGAVASKYTGLQVGLALFLALMVGIKQCLAIKKRYWGLAVLLVAVIGSPWLIRNIINTGNPVYPFFYEQLGGKNWDSFRAKIYKNEQQTFGVGRSESGGRNPAAIGHAALGLAYQPGRFINPGQEEGSGVPMGAIGPVTLLALLSGFALVRSRWSVALLVFFLVFFAQWFFLSQQVRYLTSVVPLGAAIWALLFNQAKPPRLALQSFAAAQAIWAFALLNFAQLQSQLPVLFGAVDRNQAQQEWVPFTIAAQQINQLPQTSKVALYDEVFGYLLNVSYWWANPGHSTQIPYPEMKNGDDFAQRMSEMGFTHVYVSLSTPGSPYRHEMAASLGLPSEAPPLNPAQIDELKLDLQTQWQGLLVEAVRNGKLKLIEPFSSGPNRRPFGVLLEIRR